MSSDRAVRLCAALALPMLWGCSDDRAHQKTPTIAYTVIQHAVIDLTKGKGEFADTLTKYFGTTCSEGKDVIDYAETMETRDKVDVDVELQIREALSALHTITHKLSIITVRSWNRHWIGRRKSLDMRI